MDYSFPILIQSLIWGAASNRDCSLQSCSCGYCEVDSGVYWAFDWMLEGS